MASNTDTDRVAQDIKNVALFFGGMSALGLVLVVAYTISRSSADVASQALWAIGLWVAGLGVGFLFAIPKVLQSPATSPPTPNAEGTGEAAVGTPTSPRGLFYD